MFVEFLSVNAVVWWFEVEHGDGDVGGSGDDALQGGVFLGRREVHSSEAGHV